MREIETASRRNLHEVTSINRLPGKESRLSKRAREAEAAIRIEGERIDIELRRHIIYLMYGLLTLSILVTFAMVFLVGLGIMRLSDKVIITLIGQTVGQIIAAIKIPSWYLFLTRGNRRPFPDD